MSGAFCFYFRKALKPLRRFGARSLGLVLLIVMVGLPTVHAPASDGGLLPNPPVFGVEMTPIDVNGGLNLIAPPQTQTYWTRGIEVIWSASEPVEGAYNWNAPEFSAALLELQNAVNNGLTPIVGVRSIPAWAQKYAGYSCGPVREDKLQAFGKFMYHLLHDSPMAQYQVKYWEIVNEPDRDWTVTAPDFIYGGCWGEPGDEKFFGGEYYGKMLQAVYPWVKQADAKSFVLVGGLALDCILDPPPPGKRCSSSRFLEGILHYNHRTGGNYFDGVSFHGYDYYTQALGKYVNANWYSSWNTTGPVTFAKARFIRLVLRKYGFVNKFLMNTENALILCIPEKRDCSQADPVGELTKAYYVAQSYAMAISERLWANIWFDANGDWQRNNGLLTRDLTPLPAYRAYQFASQELGGVTYIGRVPGFPHVAGFEFAKGKRHIWLIWSLDGKDHVYHLPVTPLAIYDVFGNVKPITRTLTVTLEPTYLETPPVFPRVFFPIYWVYK